MGKRIQNVISGGVGPVCGRTGRVRCSAVMEILKKQKRMWNDCRNDFQYPEIQPLLHFVKN